MYLNFKQTTEIKLMLSWIYNFDKVCVVWNIYI